MISKWPAKLLIMADLKDRAHYHKDIIEVLAGEEAVGKIILPVHKPKSR